MIRFLDIFISFFGLILLFPILIIIVILIQIDTNSPLFCQIRVGKNKLPFMLIKFRTMKIGTPSVGTHLVDDKSITKLGYILR